MRKGLNGHRKENVSLVFQNYNLIDYLTPVENVRLGGKEDAMGLLRSMGLDAQQGAGTESGCDSDFEERFDCGN
jgi:putative ABC transport system ATP-binding protein